MQLTKISVLAGFAALTKAQLVPAPVPTVPTVPAAPVSEAALVNDFTTLAALASRTQTLAVTVSTANLVSSAPKLISYFQQIASLLTSDATSLATVTTSGNALSGVGGVGSLTGALPGVPGTTGIPGTGTLPNPTVPGVPVPTVPSFTGAEQDAIYTAWHGFVVAQQQVLTTVAAKEAALDTPAVTNSLASLYTIIAGNIDAVTNSLVASIPTYASLVTADHTTLATGITSGISAFAGASGTSSGSLGLGGIACSAHKKKAHQRRNL